VIHVAINAQLVTFGQTYQNAGVSRFTYTLLEALDQLADDDLRYTAYVSSAEAAAAAASPLGHSKHILLEPARWPTDKPIKRIVWEQTRLPARLRESQADVFHAPVNVLPERLPCPSVVTIHDLAFVHYPEYFRPARRLYQRAFTERSAHAATQIVTDSESTREDVITAFGIAPERVRVIYPTISPDFQPIRVPATLAAFRARHGLPERYLLYLGTLEPRKNVIMLVEAYARLRAESEAAPPLILAGAKGWYYDALFERVRALDLERYVTFAGYVSREEQALWYAGAALFLYPSLYEGFGLPVAEALACGTPTITSDVSSLPEVAGPVALQVPPTDVVRLAHTMRLALADSGLRARTMVEGPSWTQQFSMERLARQYAQVYRVAAQSPR
jgi:glycosyltransferase involved in cell wall biosynthesis